ncbi:MAG: hypothetical protein NTZ74_03515 [Chloroflexi bacterium]|nr:hypothetical protein [Chloroflexota bacterium]
MNLTQKLYPAVQKPYLILLAGILWSAVGIMLCLFASNWFGNISGMESALVLIGGLTLTSLIYFFGFSKLALKNIRRIGHYTKTKICVFAFQKWSSYPLVLVMVSMGIYLRKYSSIPKPILAVLYIGLGGSLFLSSLLYYKHIFREKRNQISTNSGGSTPIQGLDK